MIGTERLGVTSRPNLYSPIANHCQLQPIATELVDVHAQVVRSAFGPIEKYVDTHEFFLARRSRSRTLHTNCLRICFLIRNRLKNLRPLAEALNDGVCKLFCSDLLLTDFLVVDVIRMNSVFDGAEPRVVHLFCEVR